MADFYVRCDEVWAVSEDAAKKLRSYGYKNDISVVQNGTEMRTPSPFLETVARERSGLGEQPILLYVGQLDYKKNLRMLIEAAALLKKQGHAFQLVFAGQGRDMMWWVKQKNVSEVDLMEELTSLLRVF